MSCEHEVRFTIKPTDDACRFHFDVRAYKDRIVAPDEYSGSTEVTPSDSEQVLATKDKTVRANITVNPAPVEGLLATSNGQFTPSSGKVGFSAVTVDVNPDLRPLSISENGTYEPEGFDGYSSVTADIEPNLDSLSVTENGLYLPDSGADGFDRVSVDVPQPSGSTTITQNGTYNVEQYASAVVDVPHKWDINDFADASLSGDVVLDTALTVREYKFAYTEIDSISAPNVVSIESSAFRLCANLKNVSFPKCTTAGDSSFIDCNRIVSDFVSDFPVLENIGNSAFQRAFRNAVLILPETVKTIGRIAFQGQTRINDEYPGLQTAYFRGTPNSVADNIFNQCGLLKNIYVPWSSGEVANAPWGATSATIHYDTVYDEEWNVISST